MSDKSQITMMLYSGLTSNEESKLKEIENGVISQVMRMYGNVRPIWQCASSGGSRTIQLCVPTVATPIIWQAIEEELLAMSSIDVLAAVSEAS